MALLIGSQQFIPRGVYTGVVTAIDQQIAVDIELEKLAAKAQMPLIQSEKALENSGHVAVRHQSDARALVHPVGSK